MTVVIVPVVGITFAPGYPNTIHLLRRAMEEVEQHRGSRPEGPSVVLRRNPDNPHDRNAIEVHVPAIGQMIGHVGREHAARWAPKLDAGETPRCWVESVRVKDGHEDRPGIDIRTEWGPRAPAGDAIERSLMSAADQAGVAYAPGFEPVMTDDGAEIAHAPSGLVGEGDTNDYWP